jgi:hypothetical protein
MLTCVGRCHLGDLGSMAIGVRIVTALVIEISYCDTFDLYKSFSISI